jgi:phosphoribosyl-AMP cyclohydrolase
MCRQAPKFGKLLNSFKKTRLLPVAERLSITRTRMSFLEQLKFNQDGLIPAIIQEQSTGRVLMMAWMNRQAIEKTLAGGKTVFWSRSRQKYWVKGETSGHVQIVKDLAFDCDADTLLIQVEQSGAACHEGYKSCFFRSARENGATVVVTEAQLVEPDQVYGKK